MFKNKIAPRGGAEFINSLRKKESEELSFNWNLGQVNHL